MRICRAMTGAGVSVLVDRFGELGIAGCDLRVDERRKPVNGALSAQGRSEGSPGSVCCVPVPATEEAVENGTAAPR